MWHRKYLTAVPSAIQDGGRKIWFVDLKRRDEPPLRTIKVRADTRMGAHRQAQRVLRGTATAAEVME